MLNKSKYVLLAFALAATPISESYAKAPAPEITPERAESISLCIEETKQILREVDNRQTTFHDFYFDGPDADENKVNIRTAMATGKYQHEADKISILGQVHSLMMFNTDSLMRAFCISSSDQDGKLSEGNIDYLKEMAGTFYASDREILKLMQFLNSEGQKLIDEGVTPPREWAPGTSLFDSYHLQ